MKERTPRKRDGKQLRFRSFFDAITVGSGKQAEPYIIAFHYASDNVAGKSLGTLFGFFEVDVHDHDAAYIVNFLASVAKKEYFVNPRRGIEESFESALHKVNVALAEIVKEGNVSWLGHLHGILGVQHEAIIHFSATGDGVLALIRETSFRSISDGLAEILDEPHPLKTFTEVASGALADGDVLLALSPAIWTLFTPDDLRKNLHRLGRPGFEQFLRTALINELALAGAVVIRIEAEAAPAPVSTAESEPTEAIESSSTDNETTVGNVWSGKIFEQVKASKQQAAANKISKPAPSLESEHQAEYTDIKTGHIYVQGESDPAARADAWQTKITLWQEASLRHWQITREKVQRFNRRTGKQLGFARQAAASSLSNAGRRILRHGRVAWRRIKSHLAERQSRMQDIAPPIVSNTPAPEVPKPQSLTASWRSKWNTSAGHSPLSALASKTGTVDRLRIHLPVQQMASSLQETSITTLKKIGAGLETIVQAVLSTSRALTAACLRWWRAQSRQARSRVLGAGAALLGLGLLLVWYSSRSTLWSTPAPTPAQESVPTVSSVTEPTDPHTYTLSDASTLISLNADEQAVGLQSLDDIPFLITTQRIVNLATLSSTPLTITPRLATAMDDLNGIFLIDTSEQLSFFTPNNGRIVTNTLPLPPGTTADAIDSYLTYLYVLDRTHGNLYRFPRTEGGFGEPTRWNKETLTLDPTSPLALQDSVILIGSDHLPALYERGRRTNTTFEAPQTPLEGKSLALSSDSNAVYILDPSTHRIVHWDRDGSRRAQYLLPENSRPSAFVSANQMFYTVDRQVTAFKLPPLNP